MSGPQTIVIGGGLSGLSAAHTVLERGGRVVVIDKSSFFGGNSTKATSGINGALTKTQIANGIKDSAEIFYEDTKHSARGLARPNLIKALADNSGPAVEWLQDAFKLDLSLVSRLGGHSHPRTHRGKERFPGMTITYALMEKLEAICEKEPHRARSITKARVTRLLTDASGAVTGVEYEKGGQKFQEHGPVVIATGGYAADFSEGSLLSQFRPDLLYLPTTNGEHCTGDGIKMAMAIGGNAVDMKWVQVHPTGLVDLNEPDAKVKFLAAEALRGVGGLLLNKEGDRFCNELGHRDYVSGKMWENKKAPYRLILNGKGSKEIEWHCKHYVGRGLMKHYKSGADLAKDMGITPAKLEKTFSDYNKIAQDPKTDPFGKKFFDNLPFVMNDEFHVAIVTPVLHYCMGGLEVDELSRVISKSGKPIPGLWCSGEAAGGVHGENRLGGNSLLDCVVFGRLAGADAAGYMVANAGKLAAAAGSAQGRIENVAGHVAGGAQASTGALREISYEEVARHNTEKDCWVVINGQVLDCTNFLKDHPGGKKAIMLFAGKDASEEFNMLHKPEVVMKYAPETVIGTIKGGAKAGHGAAAPAPAKAAPSVAGGVLSVEEVAKHNTEKDCWIIINGKVYDVTSFLNEHPGGKNIILKVGGQDASKQFEKFHDVASTLAKYSARLYIGDVGKAPAAKTTEQAAKEPEFIVPYGDPNYAQGWNNPGYYNESHWKWRAAIRKFTDEVLTPNCHEWDEKKTIPKEIFKKAYEAGILPAAAGAHWPVEFAGANLAGGIKPEAYDVFHGLILLDELARCGSGGVVWGLMGGMSIGLPPILHFGSDELKARVCGPCLKGDKFICLAITEPAAGSDVSNLTCEAKKSPCGKYYIVNGEKKWITNGVWSDYFTVAVRTGGAGMGGVSLLMVERGPGVTTRQMQCMGVWASGTAYITFENAMVPVENLIGEENEGFKYIMFNFNQERLSFCAQANRFSRVCYEEAFKYALKRKTFGKRLIDHPVIRQKLAEMARQIEANWAWNEQIVYQLKTMSWMEAALKLAGPVALCKVQQSKTFEFCAREAAQIFGGLSYSRGGQGEKVERLYREVRAWAIPGGSEEIMLELGFKMAMKEADGAKKKAEKKAKAAKAKH